MASPKVLTHGQVVEIIATTRVPEGAVSADDLVLKRIEEYVANGYVPDMQAAREVAIRKRDLS